MNAYASTALTGVLFTQKDATGESFLDARHSGMYLDIQAASGGKTAFFYKTKTLDMEKYLAFMLFKTTSGNPHFKDNAITIEL